MSMTIRPEAERTNAIRVSTAALKRWSNYQLPPELDRRILDLGERKESLTESERLEFMAWIEFTQQKSIDKLSAEVALKRLEEQFPEAVDRS